MHVMNIIEINDHHIILIIIIRKHPYHHLESYIKLLDLKITWENTWGSLMLANQHLLKFMTIIALDFVTL